MTNHTSLYSVSSCNTIRSTLSVNTVEANDPNASTAALIPKRGSSKKHAKSPVTSGQSAKSAGSASAVFSGTPSAQGAQTQDGEAPSANLTGVVKGPDGVASGVRPAQNSKSKQVKATPGANNGSGTQPPTGTPLPPLVFM